MDASLPQGPHRRVVRIYICGISTSVENTRELGAIMMLVILGMVDADVLRASKFAEYKRPPQLWGGGAPAGCTTSSACIAFAGAAIAEQASDEPAPSQGHSA